MALPSVHIKDILVAAGYEFSLPNPGDWNVWIGKQPSFPDRAVTIYDGPGLAPNPRWLLDFPSVQVRIRGTEQDYEVAYKKAKEVQNLTVGIPSYTGADNDRIVMVNGIGDVAFAGWGDNSRPEFVFNLRLIVEPAPSANTHREPL